MLHRMDTFRVRVVAGPIVFFQFAQCTSFFVVVEGGKTGLNGERKKWHFKGLSQVEIART